MAQACGGTLVGDKYVITAAHCVEDSDGIMSPDDLFVRVGDTSLATIYEATAITIGVQRVQPHPDYSKQSHYPINDIAILELDESVSLTAYPNIKPACLPSAGATFPGPALVSGWGTVHNYSISGFIPVKPESYLNSWLHEANVTVFADGDCGAMNEFMNEDMLCAGLKQGGKDACQGDSGGPLVASDPANNHSQTLIGVVSWGFGCGASDALGIYAEVSHFTSWLEQEMPDLASSTCPPPPYDAPVTSTTPAPTTSTTPAPTTTPAATSMSDID